jgi:nicotinamidase/pyrazinamidase
MTASVLLVIDVQNDFLPGGALAVPRGDAVLAVINSVARKFENVILTQDWHPPQHISFASSHPGKSPFETIELPYGPQVLWPPHCVQGTHGAAFAAGLDISHAQAVIRKGHRSDTDSYSAFVEADRKARTGLASLLRELGVTTVYCCGLATDFCVAWSALDAREAGFETFVIADACRAIDQNGSLAMAHRRMTDVGVKLLDEHSL